MAKENDDSGKRNSHIKENSDSLSDSDSCYETSNIDNIIEENMNYSDPIDIPIRNKHITENSSPRNRSPFINYRESSTYSPRLSPINKNNVIKSYNEQLFPKGTDYFIENEYTQDKDNNEKSFYKYNRDIFYSWRDYDYIDRISRKTQSQDNYIPAGKNFYSKSCENTSFIQYDPILHSKGAGIIPYTKKDGQILFLLQQYDNPLKKKDAGWNDFGGKINSFNNEDAIDAACREFSEETSCLFYLKELGVDIMAEDSEYQMLKNSGTTEYDNKTIEILKSIIPRSQIFFSNKLKNQSKKIYISSKETYISFLLYVDHIPVIDLPLAEDLHIYYKDRYTRHCKWFTYDELIDIDEKAFHKRLQITKIKQRISNYYENRLLIV